MSTARFLYKNLWRDGVITSAYGTTEHPQFPRENTQDDDTSLPWRSCYGVGSGGGYFAIGDSNKYINFDEGGAELTGTVVGGAYSGTSLATAIAVAMNAAPGKALTYACAYSETTCKFTISAGANFTIRWQSGTNKAADISALCGFSDAANDTGDKTYTGDYVSIHIYERIYIDFGSIQDYNFVAFLNHNIQAGTGTLTVYGADDADCDTGVVTDVITVNANNLFFFLSATRTKRYLFFSVSDPTNPSGYIQIGTIIIGSYLEPSQYYGTTAKDQEDNSIVEQSDGGNLWAVEKNTLDIRSYNFRGLSNTDAANIDTMIAEVGGHKAIVLCLDSTAPNTNSYWVNLTGTGGPHADDGETLWTWEMSAREHT